MSSKNATRNKKNHTGIVAVFIVLVVLAIVFTVPVFFKVKKVNVTGDRFATHDEVASLALDGTMEGPVLSLLTDIYDYNSLFLTLFGQDKISDKAGFVESYSIGFDGPNEVTVHVKEREIVGYVVSDGFCWFCDKNGRVVAKRKDDGAYKGYGTVPVIAGLELSGEPQLMSTLPVESFKTDVFYMFRSLVTYYEKGTGRKPDAVIFDKDQNMTLVFGDIKVALGNGTYLDIRLDKMAETISGLIANYKGTLRLDLYDGNQNNLPFEGEKKESE